MGEILKMAACGFVFAAPVFASTVTVNVGEEHQVIRGFGGITNGRAVAAFPKPMQSLRSVRVTVRLV